MKQLKTFVYGILAGISIYYFSITGMWSVRTFGYVLVMTLGDAIGGVLIPVLRGRLDGPRQKA